MDLSALASEIISDPRIGLPVLRDEQATVVGIQAYLSLLGKWNQRFNLSADRDPVALLTRHVFDSLLYSRALVEPGEIVDVGSGAGFPGIPLKLAFPERAFVLVEAQRKRVSFLQEVIRQLKLPGITVVHNRAESLSCHYKGRFQYALFKAVAPLADCLFWGEPLLQSGGQIIIKKEPTGPAPSPQSSYPGLFEQRPIPTINYSGVASQLTIFQKCST